MDTARTAEFAHIGKSVIIKGELSGSEDLYVDGLVEGAIELQGNCLIVGPHGKVRASINAKGVTVLGNVVGNINASEKAELQKTAEITGDILTQRITIEEGAYLKGKVDVQTGVAAVSLSAGQEPRAEAKPAAASAGSMGPTSPRVPGTTSGVAAKNSGN